MRISALTTIGIGTLLVPSNFTAQENKIPNVIIIYTDDQGTVDLNCFGAEDLVTPHTDKLVESGTKFTQFYGHTVCSPSRAGLLTGKTPERAGVPGNVGARGGLGDDQYTMADMFKDAGYKTALIGKWHLGESEDKQPKAKGFDYSFGHLGGCIDNFSHFFYWAGPNRHDLYRNGEEVFYCGEFFPDLMIKEASLFMGKNRKNPFFIYFSLNTPHYPYQGTPEWIEYYQDKGVAYPRDLYAAFISTKDENAESQHINGYCWQLGNHWAARKGEWKLLGNPRIQHEEFSPADSLFLVNLNNDPGEMNNLAEGYPEKVKELKNLYERWAERYQ